MCSRYSIGENVRRWLARYGWKQQLSNGDVRPQNAWLLNANRTKDLLESEVPLECIQAVEEIPLFGWEEKTMDEKHWCTVELTINGFTYPARYTKENIEELFLPFLRRLTDLRKRAGRRIIAFVAAPPAVGKSTLVAFLERLSRECEELHPIQAIGLDGFHYHSDYLKSHTIERDGKHVLMQSVKGCPETFNVRHFIEKLHEMKQGDTLWPVYDRQQHDVKEDALRVTGDVILIEGNWLLLADAPWQMARKLADATLFLRADAKDLKERLIGRKMKGGATREAATAFYGTSDGPNARRVLRDSVAAEETWTMLADGSFQKAN